MGEATSSSPFNLLFLSLDKEERWRLIIGFWPNAFTPNAEVHLTITVASPFLRQRAVAINDAAVDLQDLADTFRGHLKKARGLMTVEADGIASRLYFDSTDLPAVLAALEECAKTLR